MHIACLMPTDAVADAVTAHLSLAGMDVLRYDDIHPLLHALRQGYTRAVLIEHAEERLDGWLALLHEHRPSELPIVVVSSHIDANARLGAFAGAVCDHVALPQVADLPLRLSGHCAAQRRRGGKPRVATEPRAAWRAGLLSVTISARMP